MFPCWKGPTATSVFMITATDYQSEFRIVGRLYEMCDDLHTVWWSPHFVMISTLCDLHTLWWSTYRVMISISCDDLHNLWQSPRFATISISCDYLHTVWWSPYCVMISTLCDDLHTLWWSQHFVMTSTLCDDLHTLWWSPYRVMISTLCDDLHTVSTLPSLLIRPDDKQCNDSTVTSWQRMSKYVFKNGNITAVLHCFKDQTTPRCADMPFLITSGISQVRKWCILTLHHHSQVQTGKEAGSWLTVLLSRTHKETTLPELSAVALYKDEHSTCWPWLFLLRVTYVGI
jgi:hypothetical protein